MMVQFQISEVLLLCMLVHCHELWGQLMEVRDC